MSPTLAGRFFTTQTVLLCDIVIFLGQEDPLEKETATHSSIVAWRIPWTEEPGGLQSTGSQRVGHDWATSLWIFTYENLRHKEINNLSETTQMIITTVQVRTATTASQGPDSWSKECSPAPVFLPLLHCCAALPPTVRCPFLVYSFLFLTCLHHITLIVGSSTAFISHWKETLMIFLADPQLLFGSFHPVILCDYQV